MITALELQEKLLQACSELHNVSVSTLTDKVVVCDTLNEDISFTVEIVNKRAFHIVDSGDSVNYNHIAQVQAYTYYRFALVKHYGYGIAPEDAFGTTLSRALLRNWDFAYKRTPIADHDHTAAEMFLYDTPRPVLGPKTTTGYALFDTLTINGIMDTLKTNAAKALYEFDNDFDTHKAIQQHLDGCVDKKQIQKASVSNIYTKTITWKELYPNHIKRLYAIALYHLLKLFKVPFNNVSGKASVLKQLALFVTEHEIVYGEDSQEDVVKFYHYFPTQHKTRSAMVSITPIAAVETINVSFNIVE